jgi:hypothetical protein
MTDSPEAASDEASVPDAGPKVTTPGNAAGVVVPHEHAAAGTSEETPAADGVYPHPTKESEPTDNISDQPGG